MTMTLQEVFDNAWRGVLGQREASAGNNGTCKYRMFSGRRCGIGWSIPDDLYHQDMETKPVDMLIERWDELPFAHLDVDGLDLIQRAHDEAAWDQVAEEIRHGQHFRRYFTRYMRKTAADLGLTVPPTP